EARKQNPATFSEVFVGPLERQFYAHFAEFGTEHSAPKPYMRPAWDEKQDECMDIVPVESEKPKSTLTCVLHLFNRVSTTIYRNRTIYGAFG
ncbi:hypothetical protein, partial [Asticcacaulis taihuensis]|uniref:hypothetical protein n=2 Tax=Asticcacaulis TaxID=76890 RepID=UPI003F7B61DB